MNKEMNKIKLYFLDLPRFSKLIIYLVVDSFLCFLTVWVSFYLRLGELSRLESSIILPSLLSIIFAIPVF